MLVLVRNDVSQSPLQRYLCM